MILFVVADEEKNIYDILDHVNKVKDVYNAEVIIRSLMYVGENATLSNDRTLTVYVAHFRCF